MTCIAELEDIGCFCLFLVLSASLWVVPDGRANVAAEIDPSLSLEDG